jgi:hypothetical protein
MSKINSILLVTILVMQLVFLYFLIKPINVIDQLNSVQKINKIATLTEKPLPITELPQIGVIGDQKTLADIEEIKKANEIDAKVYASAANGDYVLGYTNGRLVIYRPADDKIIYDGESAKQQLQAGQQTLVSNVVKKVASAGLIPADYNQVPQISVVTSPEDLKKGGNEFYKDVVKDDLVANFTNPNLVVIYRPSTQQVVKSGQFQISIK